MCACESNEGNDDDNDDDDNYAAAFTEVCKENKEKVVAVAAEGMKNRKRRKTVNKLRCRKQDVIEVGPEGTTAAFVFHL